MRHFFSPQPASTIIFIFCFCSPRATHHPRVLVSRQRWIIIIFFYMFSLRRIDINRRWYTGTGTQRHINVLLSHYMISLWHTTTTHNRPTEVVRYFICVSLYHMYVLYIHFIVQYIYCKYRAQTVSDRSNEGRAQLCFSRSINVHSKQSVRHVPLKQKGQPDWLTNNFSFSRCSLFYQLD